MRKIASIAVIFCFLFFAGIAGAVSDKISLNLKGRVVEYTLPNGMKWIITKNGSAPVFSGIVQVKVGGVDEEDGKTGLAHMLEHMAFKGTDEISPEGLWDAFVTNGAVGLNAYTTKDTTAYYASMPVSKLELWMYLTSEMVKKTNMRDFYKERDVVLEELVGKQENNPTRKMDTMLLQTAFTKIPYRWPTIGFKEDVEKLEPSDLEAFKRKYYVPSRMVGAIAGNINIEQTKALLLKYFGSMPDRKTVVRKFPAEPEQKDVRTANVHFDSSPQLLLGFHKPTLPARDDYVFDLVMYVLCAGNTSKLEKSLIFEKKMARSVGCDSSYPGVRLDNLFVIEVEPIAGKGYKEVKEAVWEIIDSIKKKGLTEKEIKTAKNNNLKDYIFNLSQNENIAHTLAFFELMANDWTYVLTHVEMIDKLTSEDVVAVLDKYIKKEKMTVVELER